MKKGTFHSKKGHNYALYKEWGGGHLPQCPPGSAAPAHIYYFMVVNLSSSLKYTHFFYPEMNERQVLILQLLPIADIIVNEKNNNINNNIVF